MNDNDLQLKREIQELRAEVRRLRRTVEAGLVLLGLAAVVIFPQLLMLVLVIGVFVPIALLVSRQRGMIFTAIFEKREEHERDA